MTGTPLAGPLSSTAMSSTAVRTVRTDGDGVPCACADRDSPPGITAPAAVAISRKVRRSYRCIADLPVCSRCIAVSGLVTQHLLQDRDLTGVIRVMLHQAVQQHIARGARP